VCEVLVLVLVLVLNTKSLVSRLLLLANRSPHSTKLLSPHRPNVFAAQARGARSVALEPWLVSARLVACCGLLGGSYSEIVNVNRAIRPNLGSQPLPIG